MRLEQVVPPELVAVGDDDGTRLALLLARRGDRRYVQISSGAGLNHLRWVDCSVVRPADQRQPQADRVPGTGPALPWITARSKR